MKLSLRRLFDAVASIVLASLMLIGPAQAQDAPGMRIAVRGEITGISGDVLRVHANSGEMASIELTPQTQVRAVSLANIEDIKPGSYIGSAAVPMADGLHPYRPSVEETHALPGP